LGTLTKLFTDGNWIESKDQAKSGIRLIQTGNVGIGEYLDKKDKSRYISEETFKRLNCTEIFEGDILISRLPDPVGRACVVPKSEHGMITAVDCTIVRFDEGKILTKYFLYYAKSEKYFRELFQYLTGASRQRISRSNLAKIKIPLPPLEVQKEIVEQIEVKQNVIDHAKAVIQNLSRERRYFGQSLRILEGVEWVELGNKNLFEIQSGGTPDTKNMEYWNGNINWATLVDLPQNDFITKLSNTERKITEEGLKKSSAKMLPIDTILVSSRATIGRVAIAKEKTATNQGFKNIIVINKSKILPYFVAMCMTTKVDEMISLASGGTFKEISKSRFETLKIPIAPLDIQKRLITEAEKEQGIINSNNELIEIMEHKIADVLSEL
jgi:type I restriction enzyme S subunit